MLKFGISDQQYADLTYMQQVALEAKYVKETGGIIQLVSRDSHQEHMSISAHVTPKRRTNDR